MSDPQPRPQVDGSDAELDGVELETAPDDDQKERLEDFITELKIASRARGYLLVQWAGELAVLDLAKHTIVGVGFSYVLDGNGRITGYDCTDSILDGAWHVATPDGPRTQHDLGRTWPAR